MARVRLYDKEINYKSVYRNIKYPRLEFKTGKLLLVFPKNYKGEKDFIKRHRNWIYKKASLIEKSLSIAKSLHLTPGMSLEKLKHRVEKIIGYFSRELRVKINKLFFRRMKTKWGSCSSEGNLTINSCLRFLPKRFIEYVLFHEMVHRICRKHSGEFHKIVKERFKNSGEIEQQLFAYWFLIKNK